MKQMTHSEELPEAEHLLSAFLPRRLALARQIAQLTGWDEQKARRLAEDACEGGQPRLERQSLPAGRGRPWTVYKLTAAGAQAAAQAFGVRIQLPKVADTVELRHAVCEVDLYIVAQAARLESELEKVIEYSGDRNIRADVLVEAGNQKLIYEIEQTAGIQNLERVNEKLQHYQAFFSSPESEGVDALVRVLFKIDPQDELSLQIWSRAWKQLTGQHQPAFRIRWMSLDDFLASPEWVSLDSFQTLPEVRESRTAASEPAVQDPYKLMQDFTRQAAQRTVQVVLSREEQDWVRTTSGLFVDYLINMEKLMQSSQSRFFDLVDLIYACSHVSGRRFRYTAAMPYASLAALKSYLDRPRQADLRRQLIGALKELRSAYYRGMVMVQTTTTRLVWDVFLKYHGLARNGPLGIFVSGPDIEEFRSDFHLKVKIAPGNDGSWTGVREGQAANFTEEALTWVLEALWLYQRELGLEDNTPKRKK
jgi:predicted ArsR family transcriptional regulator